MIDVLMGEISRNIAMKKTVYKLTIIMFCFFIAFDACEK